MIGGVLTILGLVAPAATFNREAFGALLLQPRPQEAAFIIPFLAGVSEVAGQSATLLLNRVRKPRIVASLVVTGLVYVLTALIWTQSSLLIANLFSPPTVSSGAMSAVIAISFAPRMLGILTTAPYYGEFLGRLLDAWMIAIAVFGVHLAFDLPAAAAALVSISGWAVWILLRNAADRLLGPVLRRLEAAIAGRPLVVTYATVDDLIRERLAQRHEQRDR